MRHSPCNIVTSPSASTTKSFACDSYANPGLSPLAKISERLGPLQNASATADPQPAIQNLQTGREQRTAKAARHRAPPISKIPKSHVSAGHGTRIAGRNSHSSLALCRLHPAQIQLHAAAPEEACGKPKFPRNRVLTFSRGVLILVSSLVATLLDREAITNAL